MLYELGLKGGEMFAYKITGGSNLDLPAEAFTLDGREVNLVEDILKQYDIVLCISTYSATAPLTAFAKQFGFRGATMHGMNEVILRSGLAVDYNEVSVQAEKLRLGMTKADWAEIDYEFEKQEVHTAPGIGRTRGAEKPRPLPPGGPDMANLPAGEIYYVPDRRRRPISHALRGWHGGLDDRKRRAHHRGVALARQHRQPSMSTIASSSPIR